VALNHQKIKSKADYINNLILNVLKYIFNIRLIIKLYRVKKEVVASVFIKTIKYYENTICTLKKGKKKSAQLSCVEVLDVNVGFF
jgi:hypothetical protein